MEDAEIRFFKNVVDGFDYCAKREPDLFVIIDGNNSIDEMSDKIFSEVICRIDKLVPVGYKAGEGEENRNAS